MTQNPYLNALMAAAYIALIVSGIFFVGNFAGPEESIFIPMAMLSLFVLSAAVMGYLFCYQPFRMYFDGKQKEAVAFFAKTVGTFACFGLVFAIVALLLSSGVTP